MYRKYFAIILLYLTSLIFLLHSSYKNFMVIVIPLSILAFLSSIHIFSHLQRKFQNIYKVNRLDHDEIKKRIILFLVYLSVYFILKKAAPKEWIIFEQDNATYLFFSYLPLVWLLKIPSSINAYFAIIAFISTAFYSLFNLEMTSDTFAILAFFFFTLSVVQAIKEQIILNKST